MSKGKIVTKSVTNVVGKGARALSAKGGILLALIVGIGVIAYSFSGASFTGSNTTSKNNTAPEALKSLNFDQSIFKFTDNNGTLYDINGLKGYKNTLFYFFKTNCIECLAELKTIITTLQNAPTKDFVLIVVTPDTKEALQQATASLPAFEYGKVSDKDLNFYRFFGIETNLSTSKLAILDKNLRLYNIFHDYVTSDLFKKNIQQLSGQLTYNTTNYTNYTFNTNTDHKNLQNGCVLADRSLTFKSEPSKIDYASLKQNIKNDDLIGCIDTIYPTFENLENVKSLKDTDQVFYITINGKTKVYLQSILTYHPYLEDVFEYLPIGIMYDNLTNTINVFSRIINGQEKSFLYSGRVYNNHYFLIDKQDLSLWNGKEAVGGPYSGYSLQPIPVYRSTFKNISMFKNTLVVNYPSRTIDYTQDPLSAYRKNDDIVYPLDRLLTKYPRKEEVIKIENDMIPLKDIKFPYNGKTASGLNYLIILDSNNAIRVYNRKIGDKVYSFDNKTGVIVDKEELASTTVIINKKKVTLTPSPSSSWNQNMISTDGPLKDNQLREIIVDRGFYFYLQLDK